MSNIPVSSSKQWFLHLKIYLPTQGHKDIFLTFLLKVPDIICAYIYDSSGIKYYLWYDNGLKFIFSYV